jgi:hypothetical protein
MMRPILLVARDFLLRSTGLPICATARVIRMTVAARCTGCHAMTRVDERRRTFWVHE